MNKLFVVFGFLLLALGWSSCSETPSAQDEEDATPTSLIRPPLPDLVKNFERFELDLSKGGDFQLPSGSSIKVPANAFVDAQGNPATGKAELRFREYQDAVDVFLSGIPMSYQDGRFETAGMFEIRAVQEDQALEVAPGKKVNVRLASMKAEDDYDFFALDEYQGWDKIDSNLQPEINTEKVELRKKIKKMNPGLKFPLGKNYFVGNYDAILDIEFKDNWSEINKNKENPAVGKKAKSYGLTWYDFYLNGDVKFKGNTYPAPMMVWKKISGKAFPKWMKEREKDAIFFVKPVSGNVYRIEGIKKWDWKKKDQKPDYSCKIRAIMPLKRLYAYSPGYWASNYEKAMAEIEREEARVKKMAEVYRSFDLQGMGIYNYDRLMKPEEAFAINADFASSVAGSDAFELDRVYGLATKEEAVIDLPRDDWDNLYISKNYPLRFISVLPNQEIGVYSVEQYEKIDFDKLRAAEGTPSFRFELRPEGQAKSEEELRDMLSMN